MMMKFFIVFVLSIAAASATLLTTSQKQDMLNAHNLLRAETARGQVANQPKAANMKLMEWSDALAETANNWVVQCTAGHDQNSDRLIPGYTSVGQNWAGSYNMNYSTRTGAWFDEYQFYTFVGQGCSGTCGHYTQVVWAESELVGCAQSACPYPSTVVCNYAPAGNYIGKDPYISGEPCSKCGGEFSYCLGGAVCATKDQCDRSGQTCTCSYTASSCENGGTFDSANCKCTCADGYYGGRCESACANADGWDWYCTNHIALNLGMCSQGYAPYCPSVCGVCKTESAPTAGSITPKVLGA